MAQALPESPVVLLTGASAGLGLVIAEKLIEDGQCRLILTARQSSMHRFEDAGIRENDTLWLRPLDVTRDDERRAVVDEAEERWGGVDVLINNAGVSYRAVVEHVHDEDRLSQMNVNFRAPMDLTRLVLPTMRAKRRGRILNISSVGGMMAMPTMAVYSASKFALEGATEALWYEVKPWNISVSLIQPGFINSEGFQKVKYTDQSELVALGNESAQAYEAHYTHMTRFIGSVMRRSLATPESVARHVIKTMNRRNPPLRVPATLDAWIFSAIRRVAPRRLYHWLLYRGLPSIESWGSEPAEDVGTGSGSDTPRDE